MERPDGPSAEARIMNDPRIDPDPADPAGSGPFSQRLLGSEPDDGGGSAPASR
jgi:hypothetical protein